MKIDDLPAHWKPSALAAGVTASLIAAAVVYGVHLAEQNVEHPPYYAGCITFGVIAQNRYAPAGTRQLAHPAPLAATTGPGFGPNEIISVDGWIHGTPAYPNNTPPFDSDVWFRLADHKGWVSFAGVRAVATAMTTPDDPDGGTPAAMPVGCELPAAAA